MSTGHGTRLRDRGKKTYDWLTASGRLLDIGCHDGGCTAHYARKAVSTCGIDLHQEPIISARENYGDINFLVADAEQLPFRQDTFDAVVMNDVLEHVSDDKKALQEVSRVLKPLGQLCITVPHRGLFRFLDSGNYFRVLKLHFPSVYRTVYRIKKGAYPPPGKLVPPQEHRHYSLSDIVALLSRDFEIHRHFRSGLLLYPLMLNFEYFTGVCFGNRDAKRVRALCNILADFDYRMRFGAFAYNLAIYATKRQSAEH